MHTLCSIQCGSLCEVEVALTIFKLTQTGGQSGRQRADRWPGKSNYRDVCVSKNTGNENKTLRTI